MSQLFRITHETGDLSEYDSTVVDGGDLSVTVGAALIGVYGLSVNIDDTTSIYGQVDIVSFTADYFGARTYFDPNGIDRTGDGIVAEMMRVDRGSSPFQFARVELHITGGSHYVRAVFVEDDGTLHFTSTYTVSDAKHYFEIRLVKASSAVSNDASGTLYIDGVLKETISSLDIYDIFNPTGIRIGALSPSSSVIAGAYYLDDLVVVDDAGLIGGAAVINQIQGANLGADLYNGTII